MALTDFIKAPSKKSLLAILKNAKNLTPSMLSKIFDGVVFKNELRGFTSDGAVDHGALSGLSDDDHTQYLRKDGSRALTANWDAGGYEIRSSTFESDVATGTAPLTVASTTVVTNLNADKLDGYDEADFTYTLISGNDANTDVTGAELEELSDGSDTSLHNHGSLYYTETEVDTLLTGYLPLTAGAAKPLTGDLYISKTGGANIFIQPEGVSTDRLVLNVSDSTGIGGALFAAFDVTVSSGVTEASIEPRPLDGTSNASLSLFTNTNTTGTKTTRWYKGDGTSNIYHYIVNDVAGFGDYTGGNYVQIRPEGLYLVGTATMWDDLRVAADSSKLGGSKDPDYAVFKTNGSGSQGVFLYWFDDGTEEEVYFSIQMPHAWAEGTDIEPHVHWVAASTAAGAGTDVCWGLEYTWANINGTFGNTTIIYADEQTNGATETITAGKHYLTDFPAISGSGKTMSSMLICRLFRDAGGTGGTDDLVGDAGLLEFDLHYQINSMGSKEEYVKGP